MTPSQYVTAGKLQTSSSSKPACRTFATSLCFVLFFHTFPHPAKGGRGEEGILHGQVLRQLFRAERPLKLPRQMFALEGSHRDRVVPLQEVTQQGLEQGCPQHHRGNLHSLAHREDSLYVEHLEVVPRLVFQGRGVQTTGGAVGGSQAQEASAVGEAVGVQGVHPQTHTAHVVLR